MEFSPELMKSIEGAGLKIFPVEEHAVIKGKHRNQIILGYAHLKNTDIRKGILRLKEVLD